jgi:hypothetical protein
MSIIDDKLSEVFNSEKLKVSEPTEPYTNLEVIKKKIRLLLILTLLVLIFTISF